MDGRPRQRALPAALALIAVALSSAAAVAAPSAASLARADRRLGAEEAALDRSMTAHRASLLEVRQRIDSLQQGFADRAALVDGVVADLRAQSLPGVLGGLAESAPPGREILVSDRRQIARLSRALAGRQERRGVQRALVDAGLAKARAREAAQAAARKRAEARRAAAAARAAALAPNRTGPPPPPPSYRPAPTARTIEPGLPADVIARRLLR